MLVALGAASAMLVQARALGRSASTTGGDLIQLEFDSGPPIDVQWDAISPDGRRVVADGRDSLGRRAIVLRELGNA
ncbi:MAG: hypothetical protein U1E76_28975, partial [Planctomycetota bacterium]